MTISHKKQLLHRNSTVQYRPSTTLYAFHNNYPIFPFPPSSLPTTDGDQLIRHQCLSLSQAYRPTNQSIAHSASSPQLISFYNLSKDMKCKLSNSLPRTHTNRTMIIPANAPNPQRFPPLPNHESQIPQRSNRPQHSLLHHLYNHLIPSPRAQKSAATST